MFRLTWACFECRKAVRRLNSYSSNMRRPHCGKPCLRLGKRIPLPPRRRVAKWDELRRFIIRRDLQQERLTKLGREARIESWKYEIARLEVRIPELEAKPANIHRARAIRGWKLCKERLEECVRAAAEGHDDGQC